MRVFFATYSVPIVQRIERQVPVLEVGGSNPLGSAKLSFWEALRGLPSDLGKGRIVAECTRLESVQTRKGLEGSNPSPSAIE